MIELKRRNQRARQTFRFWYRLPWSKVWNRGLTQNVSAGGLHFTDTEGLWWKGMSIEVQIHLPGQPYHCKTRVTRVERMFEEHAIALKFTDIPHEARQNIEDQVRRWRKSVEAAGKVLFAPQQATA